MTNAPFDRPGPTDPDSEACVAGIHSWVDKVGKLPADTPCTRCGELYGDPD